MPPLMDSRLSEDGNQHLEGIGALALSLPDAVVNVVLSLGFGCPVLAVGLDGITFPTGSEFEQDGWIHGFPFRGMGRAKMDRISVLDVGG